ncbi:MAG TPA: PspC domain-containing protein [Candidatus Aminicenantes bacterium]|nr:PspC domain-containing protein [Candidatus Aminicenantes bacterium]
MKRLYRSRKNRMLGGVCGGIAEYFEIDPVIIRLVAVALFFVGGSAVLAYIIALIIIPYEPLEASAAPAASSAPGAGSAPPPASYAAAAGTAPARSGANDAIPLFLGILLIVIGGLFLLDNLPFFSPFYHEVRHYVRHFFWPSILIVFGVFLIARGWKK